MAEQFDDAVVGAGIVGLAHAHALARRGRRVVVFERSERAVGASIRNFGMLWPIGQPPGPRHAMALRSLASWHEVLEAAGIWHDRCGSLHLAYRDDEAAVLREFAASAGANRYDCEWIDAEAVRRRSVVVRAEGLIGGLWSPSETCVDPREAVAGLAGFLAERFGVRFVFGATVFGYSRPEVRTSEGSWGADHLYVCAGDDLRTLYPEALGSCGVVRCKLQMLRSEPAPGGLRLGPMLAGGLTLRHYAAFAGCPSLPGLRERVAAECPEHDRFGIHVMASQNGRGEVTIGDSHEYGDAIEPFDKDRIDALILSYLNTFLDVPGLRIGARWHGTYAKHPTEPHLVLQPSAGVRAVAALGGAGMTLSFGLAEQVVAEALGET